MFMINYQTGKSMLLEWNTHNFHAGLADVGFIQDSLNRAR